MPNYTTIPHRESALTTRSARRAALLLWLAVLCIGPGFAQSGTLEPLPGMDPRTAVLMTDGVLPLSDAASSALLNELEAKLRASLPGADILRGVQTVTITLPAAKLYAPDAFALNTESVAVVQSLVALLRSSPALLIDVIGYTDSFGAKVYNQQFSLRRAAAVTDAMLAVGLPQQNVATRGEGESQPLVAEKTAADRSRNRRVEIVISVMRAGLASSAPGGSAGQ